MENLNPEDMTQETASDLIRIFDGDCNIGMGIKVDEVLSSSLSSDESCLLRFLLSPVDEDPESESFKEMRIICRNEGFKLVCSSYFYYFGDDPNSVIVSNIPNLILTKSFKIRQNNQECVDEIKKNIVKFNRLIKYWRLWNTKFMILYYWDDQVVIDENGLMYAKIIDDTK